MSFIKDYSVVKGKSRNEVAKMWLPATFGRCRVVESQGLYVVSYEGVDRLVTESAEEALQYARKYG